MYVLRLHFSLLFDSLSSLNLPPATTKSFDFGHPATIPAESLAFAHKPLESKSSAGHFNCSQAIHSEPMKTLNEIPTIAV
ncbi:hypothetical protein F0562_030530 [Nyssa sinensis]|uniref:Uncharacterized protein n=1 Tax=Nyssa sinensis TaxID=561372 RepID=A0A5J5B179_9ASTE|nr:hypothetical protein F0562_030530 [Nyssa sinensis]